MAFSRQQGDIAGGGSAGRGNRSAARSRLHRIATATRNQRQLLFPGAAARRPFMAAYLVR